MIFTKAQKIFVGISIILVVIGVSAGGCQKQPEEYTGPVEKITVAAAEYLTGALIYVAEDQGFFEENGLDVTIKGYASGKACADALINGEVDIATSAGFVFVSNSFDLTDLRVFGTVSTSGVGGEGIDKTKESSFRTRKSKPTLVGQLGFSSSS